MTKRYVTRKNWKMTGLWGWFWAIWDKQEAAWLPDFYLTREDALRVADRLNAGRG